MIFLAVYVCIPVNNMAHTMTDCIFEVAKEKNDIIPQYIRVGKLQSKLLHLYRLVFGEMYLTILSKYGRYPEYEDQPIVDKAINGYFGYQEKLKLSSTPDTLSKKAVLGIDGITQFVLYYWPFAWETRTLETLSD